MCFHRSLTMSLALFLECMISPLESMLVCYSNSSGSDIIELLKLGDKRLTRFHPVLLRCSLGILNHHVSSLTTTCCEEAQIRPSRQILLRGCEITREKDIPRHFSQLLYPPIILTPSTIWLQLHWRPWARTASWELLKFVDSQKSW